MSSKNPFFIVGCVRSGTTLLRDLLRQHPQLECPEETHFFRWANPFGTGPYAGNYKRKALFKKHRQLDKVTDFDFFYNLQEGTDRKHLMDHYARMFLEANDKSGKRWFDKTPQNVYGLLLISGLYPKSKFLHIHRHPYNVVASLKTGKVLGKQDMTSAINFWTESLTILQQYKLGFPQRLLEISYEELTADPHAVLAQILEFVGEEAFKPDLAKLKIHPERNLYQDQLTADELSTIDERCGALMQAYNYD